MKKRLILFLLALSSCSSTHLVNNWKNPDIVIFDAYKVLIVGMTPNMDARTNFETRMKREFTKRDVEAVRSIDVFDVHFTDSERTDEELDEVEQTLLDRDFDAILFTKVIGSENRQTFRKKIADWNSYHNKFSEDYLSHQDIYYDADYYDTFTVYHAETSLYCICVGKERQLIWRGSIDITDPDDVDKATKDYVKLVTIALEEQDIIFRKEESTDETTSL
ncbi:hypothetical protein [Poritiphilus flavus]|uniref:Cardiolipin synthetase n=1 Tax=Poritiphilus flavus TaxID=2697053 RepID=A0A6L9EB01_9FLAO|nr:hypothetical protein [Poritiphilus flavus]NAS11935.1 hypothetical protein [Poritiphilus flavus]